MMIPQRHDDTIQSEERIPSPVENKQMATPLEKQSEPTAASPRRWISVRLSILAVALPLVAGSMVWWPWGVPDVFDAEWVFTTVVLGMVLTAVVGGALLRSFWALLIVPVAWIVGEILGEVLRLFIGGGWPALQNELHFWDTQMVLIPLAVVPLIVCALLGSAGGVVFSKWWKKRQQLQ